MQVDGVVHDVQIGARSLASHCCASSAIAPVYIAVADARGRQVAGVGLPVFA